MKKILFFVIAVTMSSLLMAQGKSQDKGKSEKKNESKANKQEKEHDKYDQTIWGGTKDSNGGKGPKTSKNQPSKVKAAFYKDYPNAGNVVWSKYRGDWTATFGSGLYGTKTAVYHANGERRDTRSVIDRGQLPGGGTIWDKIFKRDNIIPVEQVVVVERPGILDQIFRVATSGGTTAKYLFYNEKGIQVKYSY